MLRGAASARELQHWKSTATLAADYDRKHINPDIGRQQAKAAAMHAFIRAKERSKGSNESAENARIGFEGKTEATEKSTGNDTMTPETIGEAAERHLSRTQSVRFVGPDAVTTKKSRFGMRVKRGSSETLNTMRRSGSAATLRRQDSTKRSNSQTTTNGENNESSAPNQTDGKVGGPIPRDVFDYEIFNEIYGDDEYIVGSPSSFQRGQSKKGLHRARSMLGPVRRFPSILFGSDSQDDEQRFTSRSRENSSVSNAHSSTTQETCHNPMVHQRKSMSFLRSSRGSHSLDAPSNSTEPYKADENHATAVQAARDEFTRQVEVKRLREQPSFLIRSKSRRQEKPFRKSVRSGSGADDKDTDDNTVDHFSVGQLQLEQKMKTKVRKASHNLKSKLIRVFRRSSGSSKHEIGLPPQQVEAAEAETHDFESFNGMHLQVQRLAHPVEDGTTMSKVSTRVGSLHAVPSVQQLRSRAGSMQSIRSDDVAFNAGHDFTKDATAASVNTSSRVTSWDSGNESAGTAISRYAMADKDREREKQRLSIIQENGTHVSSSSFARTPIIPVWRTGATSAPISAPQASALTVDSQRVFSALMKRLDENSPQAKIEAQRKDSMESRTSPEIENSIPSRRGSSGVVVNHLTGLNTMTVRNVPDSRQVSAKHGVLEYKSIKSPSERRSESASSDDIFSPDVYHQPRFTLKHKDSAATTVLHNVTNEASLPSQHDGGNDTTSVKDFSKPGEATLKRIAELDQIIADLAPRVSKAEPSVSNSPRRSMNRRRPQQARSSFFGKSLTSPFRRNKEKTPSPRSDPGSTLKVHNEKASTPSPPADLAIDSFVSAYLCAQPSSSTLILHSDLEAAIDGVPDPVAQDICSESEYSRTTSGHTPPTNIASAISLLSDSNTKNVPKDLNGQVRVYKPSRPSTGAVAAATVATASHSRERNRLNSSGRAKEWQAFLSTDVRKDENTKPDTSAQVSAHQAQLDGLKEPHSPRKVAIPVMVRGSNGNRFLPSKVRSSNAGSDQTVVKWQSVGGVRYRLPSMPGGVAKEGFMERKVHVREKAQIEDEGVELSVEGLESAELRSETVTVLSPRSGNEMVIPQVIEKAGIDAADSVIGDSIVPATDIAVNENIYGTIKKSDVETGIHQTHKDFRVETPTPAKRLDESLEIQVPRRRIRSIDRYATASENNEHTEDRLELTEGKSNTNDVHLDKKDGIWVATPYFEEYQSTQDTSQTALYDLENLLPAPCTPPPIPRRSPLRLTTVDETPEAEERARENLEESKNDIVVEDEKDVFLESQAETTNQSMMGNASEGADGNALEILEENGLEDAIKSVSDDAEDCSVKLQNAFILAALNPSMVLRPRFGQNVGHQTSKRVTEEKEAEVIESIDFDEEIKHKKNKTGYMPVLGELTELNVLTGNAKPIDENQKPKTTLSPYGGGDAVFSYDEEGGPSNYLDLLPPDTVTIPAKTTTNKKKGKNKNKKDSDDDDDRTQASLSGACTRLDVGGWASNDAGMSPPTPPSASEGMGKLKGKRREGSLSTSTIGRPPKVVLQPSYSDENRSPNHRHGHHRRHHRPHHHDSAPGRNEPGVSCHPAEPAAATVTAMARYSGIDANQEDFEIVDLNDGAADVVTKKKRKEDAQRTPEEYVLGQRKYLAYSEADKVNREAYLGVHGEGNPPQSFARRVSMRLRYGHDKAALELAVFFWRKVWRKQNIYPLCCTIVASIFLGAGLIRAHQIATAAPR